MEGSRREDGLKGRELGVREMVLTKNSMEERRGGGKEREGGKEKKERLPRLVTCFRDRAWKMIWAHDLKNSTCVVRRELGVERETRREAENRDCPRTWPLTIYLGSLRHMTSLFDRERMDAVVGGNGG